MRLQKLDILRWFAISLMMLFHLNYSLVEIFHITLLNSYPFFWYLLWKASAILFITIAWLSFALAEKKYWDAVVQKYVKEIFKLLCIALCINIITYFIIPSELIVFWIIHFFTLSFALLLLIYKLKYFNLILGIMCLIIGYNFTKTVTTEYIFFLWFIYPGFYSADFYPLFPYFWYMIFGYIGGLLLYDIKKMHLLHGERRDVLSRVLSFTWKNSLLLYIIHQPIIIWIIFLYTSFSK
jgi:uncharacterized membrane protein